MQLKLARAPYHVRQKIDKLGCFSETSTAQLEIELKPKRSSSEAADRLGFVVVQVAHPEQHYQHRVKQLILITTFAFLVPE